MFLLTKSVSRKIRVLRIVMIRQHIQKRLLSGFIFFCIMLSFSILSFADAFTGAYLYTGTDPNTGLPIVEVRGVNPSNQTFSGSNVIEMNAFNNAPILTNNNFNGSTDMNLDMTNITSTNNHYNGSIDIDYSGLPDSYLESSGDTFANASVSSSASDINITNGTFNGTTNLQANNVSLGSISQMDTLINGLFVFMRSLTNAATSSTNTATITNTWNNQQVTLQLNTISGRKLQYDSTNHTISAVGATAPWPYGNFHARIVWLQQCNIESLQALGQFLSYWVGQIFDDYSTYRIYSFSSSGETYSFSSNTTTTSFRVAFINRFDVLIQLLQWFCSRFFEWYYPLDDVLPEYWRYYNTDTAQQEEIGLAGLMYNISWYLGQLYVLQTASEALDNFEDQVAAVTDTFEDAEAAEESIMQSINSGISSFNPDVNQFGAFRALGWCSNYLQLVFLRLGTYGTVLLIGLLLGVCMQFVGYFRYK